MADYASEMARLFGGNCSVSGRDWNKDRFFDSNSECYGSEAALMSSLTSEAYNKFGFEVHYYIKKIDTEIDRIYGEDPLQDILRRFTLSVYTDTIPTNQKQYQLQGMVFTEMITLQATIAHFNEASRIDFATKESKHLAVLPKIGDMMYFPYNNLYYEVINVKSFAEGSSFLSAPITYTFILRLARNAHDNVDLKGTNDTDEMQEIRSFAELGEVFNITSSSNQTSSVIRTDGDILSINEDIKLDFSLPEMEEPKDNVNSHIIYEERENKEGDDYNDPFDGW